MHHKNLQSETKYKFKVAAIVIKNGKKKVQDKSNIIVVKTKKNNKEKSEFVLPDYGSSIEDAIRVSGIENCIERDAKDFPGEYVYSGDTTYDGNKAYVIMTFNSKKEFFAYMLYFQTSKFSFNTRLSNIKKTLGEPIYSEGEQYSWGSSYTNETFMTWYDETLGRMIIMGFGNNYNELL